LQDFTGISQDLAYYKNLAQENGIYLNFSDVNNYGYELIIRPDGKIDVYLVRRILKFLVVEFMIPTQILTVVRDIH
jgi:hypothetical protein